MSRQIIPERVKGKFAIFTTVTDSFAGRLLSVEHVRDWFRARAIDEADRSVKDIFEKIEQGKKPYYNFTLTIDEAEEADMERFTREEELKKRLANVKEKTNG